MTTRRNILKGGAGLAAILAAGKAPAALVRSMLAARNSFGTSQGNAEEEMYKELFLATVGKNLSGEVILPDVEYVGRAGLAYNTSITRLELPNCTSSAMDFAASCTNLLYIDIPKIETVLQSSFSYCSNLEEVHLASATSFGAQCFNASPKLKRIYCPNIQSVSGTWCNGNTQLTDIYATNRTTAQVLAISGFPGFVNMDSVRGNITWHCSDGTITWNGSAWVANNA